MSEISKKILIVSLIALVWIALALTTNPVVGMSSVVIIPILLLMVGLMLLVTQKEPWAKVLLISSGIVLLLGVSVCMAAVMMGGLNIH